MQEADSTCRTPAAVVGPDRQGWKGCANRHSHRRTLPLHNEDRRLFAHADNTDGHRPEVTTTGQKNVTQSGVDINPQDLGQPLGNG